MRFDKVAQEYSEDKAKGEWFINMNILTDVLFG